MSLNHPNDNSFCKLKKDNETSWPGKFKELDLDIHLHMVND